MTSKNKTENKFCLLFLDESGHHGLKKINQEYPIFLLACCIFEEHYFKTIFTKKVEELKIKHFGNKKIILHSRY